MKNFKPIEDTLPWRCVDKALTWIMIISSIVLIAIVGITVFVRYCLEGDFFGSDELITLFAMWLYWTGAAYGSLEESHISADMTDLVVKKEKTRQIIKLIVRTIVLLVTAVLSYWAVFKYGAWNIKSGTTSSALNIPMIWCTGIISVSYVLMFLFALKHFVSSVVLMLQMSKKGGNEQ